MNWYLKVLNSYKDFNGRARRKEYWMFVLYNILFSFAAALLDRMLGISWNSTGYGPLYAVYGLVIIIPNLAVLIRRLHDIGKSGWMLLVVFIPFIGPFWLLYLLIKDSEEEMNQYGENPKDIITS